MTTHEFFFGDVSHEVISTYWTEIDEFLKEMFKVFGVLNNDLVSWKLYYRSEDRDVLMQQASMTTPLARLIPPQTIVSKTKPAEPYYYMQMLYDEHHIQYLYFK